MQATIPPAGFVRDNRRSDSRRLILRLGTIPRESQPSMVLMMNAPPCSCASTASSHFQHLSHSHQTRNPQSFGRLCGTGLSRLHHWSSARSAFAGDHVKLEKCIWHVALATGSNRAGPAVCMGTKPVIQFIRGIDEQTVPDVALTRSRDGTNGVATFSFDQPSVFDSSRDVGDITGLYMEDEEGVLQTVEVNAKFVNGKPAKVEAKYIMRSVKDWDRFMRFMERYAEANGLGFVKK